MQTATWNWLLLGLTVLILLLSVGTELAAPWAEADNLAEDLAPRLGVSQAQIRRDLQDVLLEGAGWRATIKAIPLALLAALLAVRAVREKPGVTIRHGGPC